VQAGAPQRIDLPRYDVGQTAPFKPSVKRSAAGGSRDDPGWRR
jgi:hypothetical protein